MKAASPSTNATKRRVVKTDPTGIAVRNAIVGKMRDFAVLEELPLAAAGSVPDAQRAAITALAKQASNRQMWNHLRGSMQPEGRNLGGASRLAPLR